MSLRNLCNHNVATISPDASLADAAAHLRSAHVGSLVVVEPFGGGVRPLGMLTDRDIVIEALAPNISLDSVRASDLMSRSLVSVREDSGLEFALSKMAGAGVRRVPVVDEQGHLVGVLSIDDAIAHVARLLSLIAATVQSEQYAEERNRP